MPLRSSFTVIGCLGGLLLGSLVGSGCTPGSSGSPASSDTSATPVRTTAQPPRDSSAESSSTPRPSASEDDARTVAQRLEDTSVEARIKQALVGTQTLRRFDFSPTVVRSHVVLRGDVDTREQYRQAERVVKTLDEVETVTNQVTVEGSRVSETDAPADDAPSEATYHTVRRGETLWRIAREYDVSVQKIQRLNDLSSSLRPGERIRVQ